MKEKRETTFWLEISSINKEGKECKYGPCAKTLQIPIRRNVGYSRAGRGGMIPNPSESIVACKLRPGQVLTCK